LREDLAVDLAVKPLTIAATPGEATDFFASVKTTST